MICLKHPAAVMRCATSEFFTCSATQHAAIAAHLLLQQQVCVPAVLTSPDQEGRIFITINSVGDGLIAYSPPVKLVAETEKAAEGAVVDFWYGKAHHPGHQHAVRSPE
jgi:hypothetical protein